MHFVFPESELALLWEKEGIVRSGSSVTFSPSDPGGRHHRPETGVWPIQIPSHPIYIDLTIQESNYGN
jgi:hypothetical protein